ncbi:MAG: hypothetical protein NTZ33_15575 [Bacteroidetes bacterium]|nr:hypothetical protein [Bacteroidota bacterium]
MIKNKKTTNRKLKITKTQLSFFAKELEDAGGFDELMIKKKAIEKNEGKIYTFTYKDIDKYKETHLIGVYEKLRPYFNTKVPYAFWSQLYIALRGGIAFSK